jgi:hypothetical protein
VSIQEPGFGCHTIEAVRRGEIEMMSIKPVLSRSPPVRRRDLSQSILAPRSQVPEKKSTAEGIGSTRLFKGERRLLKVGHDLTPDPRPDEREGGAGCSALVAPEPQGFAFLIQMAPSFACIASGISPTFVPPLEGLWWADDMATFISREKDKWSWTRMIMVPDFIDKATATRAALAAAKKKDLPALSKVRFEALEEGAAPSGLVSRAPRAACRRARSAAPPRRFDAPYFRGGAARGT